MLTGKLENDKVVVEGPEAKELYETGWYGNPLGSGFELDQIEAAALLERGKLEVVIGEQKLSLKEILNYCSERDEHFMARYSVYKDLRERGLAVRTGFKGCDFRVYERGAKPGKAETVKWIVFTSAEDYPCALEQLGKAIKLAQNIKSVALWAVVDNDSDCTYYIIESPKVG